MKYILTTVVLIILTACGGGNDKKASSVSSAAVSSSSMSSTPVSSSISSSSAVSVSSIASSTSSTAIAYSLLKLNSTQLGAVYSSAIIGTDSDGNHYTGTFSLTNQAEKTLNGVLGTPSDLLIFVTRTENTSIAVGLQLTGFIETTTGNLISMAILPFNLACISSSPYHMPSSVVIGDTGTSSTLVCTDLVTSIEGSWKVEAASGGNARVLITTESKKSSSSDVIKLETAYIIDVAGNIISVNEVVTITSSNLVLTLNSI